MTHEQEFAREVRMGDPDNLMKGSIFSIVDGKDGYLVLAINNLEVYLANVGEVGLYDEKLNNAIAFDALARPEALAAYGLCAVPIGEVPVREVEFWLTATNPYAVYCVK